MSLICSGIIFGQRSKAQHGTFGGVSTHFRVFLNCAAVSPQNNPCCSLVDSLYCEQKKERECMQLRLAVLRSELQRQRKALGREIDLQQKEKSQLQKKGRVFGSFCF